MCLNIWLTNSCLGAYYMLLPVSHKQNDEIIIDSFLKGNIILFDDY